MSSPVRLVDHRPKLPPVDLGAAGVFPLEPVSRPVMDLIHAARDPEQAGKLWDAAALLVPSAPREAIDALSPPEVQAILALATGEAGPTAA